MDKKATDLFTFEFKLIYNNEQKKFNVGYDKDLYIKKIGDTMLNEKQMRYVSWDHVIANKESLKSDFIELSEGKFLKNNGEMKKCLHHFIAFTSEAARFGVMRKVFDLFLSKNSSYVIDFQKFEWLCKSGWENKTIGLEDTLNLGGDGKKKGTFFRCETGNEGIERIVKAKE